MRRFATLLALAAAALLLAAACGGGDDGEELTLEEYFQQTEAIIDKVDEQSDALEFGGIRDYFEAYVPITRDAFDELDDIDPPATVEDAHSEFVDALKAFLKHSEDVADQLADVETEAALEAVFAVFEADPGFNAARGRLVTACLAVQDIADENDIDIDLECDG